MIRLLSVSATALLALAILAPTAVLAAPPDPVLLVHGYRGNPSTWADMKAYLEARGRTVEAIDLASEDNVVNAKAISTFVRDRGWTRVDLVGQSMGGLSARYFAKSIKSPVTVDAYVSLGTPQYGIWSACLLPSWYGGQMCPRSGFLRDLNAGDDTPGKTAWTTIYSTDDEYVPVSATRLDGGACYVQVSGVTHNYMDNDPAIMADVLAAIDGSCPGEMRT